MSEEKPTLTDAVREVLGDCAAPHSAEQACRIVKFIHERDASRDKAVEILRQIGKDAPILTPAPSEELVAACQRWLDETRGDSALVEPSAEYLAAFVAQWVAAERATALGYMDRAIAFYLDEHGPLGVVACVEEIRAGAAAIRSRGAGKEKNDGR